MENNREAPQKINNRTTMWSRNPTTGYLPKENENTDSKRYLHAHVYWRIIYNHQDRETTLMTSVEEALQDLC